MNHLPIEWLFRAMCLGVGVFAGYWIGAWHLLWANTSLNVENADLRARLRLWEKGWTPRDWKNAAIINKVIGG